MKNLINAKFRNNTHYVWCGDCFDATKVEAYSMQATLAPSSDPCNIYRRLLEESQRPDRHSEKINNQKLSLTALAAKWRDSGEISAEAAEEIVYMVENAGPQDWKPLLYVIPRAPVSTKLQLVPIAKRASWGDEFIIPDLQRQEFDIVELP